MANEWKSLCKSALKPSLVSTEPLIHNGRTKKVSVTTQQGQPNTLTRSEPYPKEQGNVGVHGFWRRHNTTIFDICVVDTDAPSYRGQDPTKIIARHEKLKQDRYKESCQELCRQFTPLVYLVDGLMGAEAQAASQQLAALLSAKWKRQYSEVCGFVLSRLALALVRTTCLCLRGACDSMSQAHIPVWESGSGLSLYH